MNLNLAIDTSNFKPYDWSLPMLIVHDYRDTYRGYRDMMDKIAEEDGLYVLPDTPENELYRATMAKYNADREAAMESFFRGMNIENARLLNNIRRRHFSEITPINKAIEAYNKDVDKIAALGPNVTIANKNNRKISDYYGGINPGIDYRDNKTIQATAAGVMQGINNALMSAPEQAGNIANQYFILKLKGINGQLALSEILNSQPNLRTEQGVADVSQLMDALDTVYSQYAFDEGTPENSLIWQQVVTGAIQGIQAPKYDLQTNHGYMNPAQLYDLEAKKRAENYKYKIENGEIVGLNPQYLNDVKAASAASSNLPLSDTNDTQPEIAYTTVDGRPRKLILDKKKNRWYDLESNSFITNNKKEEEEDAIRKAGNKVSSYTRHFSQSKEIGNSKLSGNFYTSDVYGEIGKTFEPLYLKLESYSKGSPIRSKGITLESEGTQRYNGASNDYEQIPLSQSSLSKDTIDAILLKAKEQNPNISLEDLVINVDKDNFSDDHVKVFILDTGKEGNWDGVHRGGTSTSSNASTSTERSVSSGNHQFKFEE